MYRGRFLTVIIAAGGAGTRFGTDELKQFLDIDGKSMLSTATEPFLEVGYTDEIIITAPHGYLERCRDLIENELGGILVREKDIPVTFVNGGTDRAASVRAGLGASEQNNAKESGLVLIHDAARPFVTTDLIERVLETAYKYGAAIPVVPVRDTVYVTDEEGFADIIPDRTMLRAVQTPQGFDFAVIKKAHAISFEEGKTVTDDGMPVFSAGGKVALVEGNYENKKITRQGDIYCGQSISPGNGNRVGIGFDAHRFEEGRALMLGGIKVPFEKGLSGHSDADVITHALIDAILGALSEGDIGRMFPDTDPAYKGISSILLLEEAVRLMSKKGYEVVNADITIVAERPRMTDHREGIERKLAGVLCIDPEDISLKATTTEKLGFTGREEGIAAEAVVLLKTKQI
jgi:2-C-methyl-D-erythritol 2,4-cyclodiphosphate synthase/2-C-methyl-D-erythritol 4-phosphate cytidylyltransferase